MYSIFKIVGKNIFVKTVLKNEIMDLYYSLKWRKLILEIYIN